MQNSEALFLPFGDKNESDDKIVTRWAKDCDIDDVHPLDTTTESDTFPAVLSEV